MGKMFKVYVEHELGIDTYIATLEELKNGYVAPKLSIPVSGWKAIERLADKEEVLFRNSESVISIRRTI